MQEVIREYGSAIITVVAIMALVALIVFLVGHDGSSIVGKAFQGLVSDFFKGVTSKSGI
jgi:hypothetical protein